MAIFIPPDTGENHEQWASPKLKTVTSELTSIPVVGNQRPLPGFIFVALVILLLAGLAPAVYAAGNLLVTPTRVVFEERTRSAQVTLVNQGTETGEYRISFLRQNMTEGGDFVAVAESETGLFSDPMIRYSPRQVSLSPGQSQVIRLLLRKPGDLADGEYRSHMLFQALPPPASSSVENAASNDSEGITIELIPVVGVSIPVIVRHGELTSTVKLSDAELIASGDSGDKPKIGVNINREGSGSTYGDLRVTLTPQEGDAVVVAQANSVAVYANLDRRRFEMPLNIPPWVNMVNSVLDIVFIKSGSDVESGTLAKTSLELK